MPAAVPSTSSRQDEECAPAATAKAGALNVGAVFVVVHAPPVLAGMLLENVLLQLQHPHTEPHSLSPHPQRFASPSSFL